MTAFHPFRTFVVVDFSRQAHKFLMTRKRCRWDRMGMRLIPFTLLVLISTASCRDITTFCCGYSVLDQGGSKRSLMHRGEIIESYIVTGVLAASDLTIFELRPYDSVECRYRVAMQPDRLSAAVPLVQLDSVQAGLSQAVQGGGFRPLSSRSCLSTPAT